VVAAGGGRSYDDILKSFFFSSLPACRSTRRAALRRTWPPKAEKSKLCYGCVGIELKATAEKYLGIIPGSGRWRQIVTGKKEKCG